MQSKINNALFAFLLFFGAINAQNKRAIDSLITLSQTANDTTKANLYNVISALWAGTNPEKNYEYGHKIIELGKKSGQEKYVALGNFKLGIYYQTSGNLDSAKYFYETALVLAKKNNREKIESFIHQNLGLVYEKEGNYEKAIIENIDAIRIQEKIKNMPVVADLKNNIAVIYIKQKDYVMAEKYLLYAFSDFKKINAPGTLAYVYQNLGLVENHKGNVAKRNEYYHLALKEFAISNNVFGQADIYQNLSLTFLEQNQADSAKLYNAKALSLSKSLNSIASVYSAYINYSNLYIRFFNNPVLGLAYLDSAAAIKEVFSLPEYRIAHLQQLAQYEIAYGDKTKGFALMDKFLGLKDSLLSLENIESIKNINAKYETEKKDLQIKNQSLEISAREKENEAKNKILIIGTIGLLAVLIFAFIAYNNFKKTKKANVIINSQKQQVELQKEEIETQKLLVEEKQKEIIDSINYAQKIQSAVLTGEQVWKKISPEYFIVFQPKDIVSGDFYWAYNTVNNRSVFALADCTGHGVPGGFMSMLGNSFLNEIVVENKIFNPAEILNKLRQKIITSLEQKGAADRRDGMDMAICCWNKLNNTLEFAGANNKLWIIRNGVMEEFTGDKMPVGNYAGELKAFSNKTIVLQKNDIIFLTTDGFADQFGGDSGKKLMSKNLKQFLINNSSLPIEQQKLELINFLNIWKGKHEQVDDVSVVAIKVC